MKERCEAVTGGKNLRREGGNMMKRCRFLSVLLVVVMAIGMAPSAAFRHKFHNIRTVFKYTVQPGIICIFKNKKTGGYSGKNKKNKIKTKKI